MPLVPVTGEPLDFYTRVVQHRADLDMPFMSNCFAFSAKASKKAGVIKGRDDSTGMVGECAGLLPSMRQ